MEARIASGVFYKYLANVVTKLYGHYRQKGRNGHE